MLGGFLAAAPASGASVYGISVDHAAASAYVRAVGIRDMVFAIYLIGTTWVGRRQVLFFLLAATTLIPVADLVLLASYGARPLNLLPHVASMILFALLAFWVWRGARPRE